MEVERSLRNGGIVEGRVQARVHASCHASSRLQRVMGETVSNRYYKGIISCYVTGYFRPVYLLILASVVRSCSFIGRLPPPSQLPPPTWGLWRLHEDPISVWKRANAFSVISCKFLFKELLTLTFTVLYGHLAVSDRLKAKFGRKKSTLVDTTVVAQIEKSTKLKLFCPFKYHCAHQNIQLRANLNCRWSEPGDCLQRMLDPG